MLTLFRIATGDNWSGIMRVSFLFCKFVLKKISVSEISHPYNVDLIKVFLQNIYYLLHILQKKFLKHGRNVICIVSIIWLPGRANFLFKMKRAFIYGVPFLFNLIFQIRCSSWFSRVIYPSSRFRFISYELTFNIPDNEPFNISDSGWNKWQ